jgi:DNA-binding CsgD family transcriptional regulator
MLNYSTNTIRAKKSVIRKKLGVKAFGDINDFIETTLRK